jgi:hypothetical protein
MRRRYVPIETFEISESRAAGEARLARLRIDLERRRAPYFSPRTVAPFAWFEKICANARNAGGVWSDVEGEVNVGKHRQDWKR